MWNILFRKIIVILNYLGLAPILWLFRRRIRDEVVKFHVSQAIVLFFWFLLLIIFLLITVALLSIIILYFPDFYQQWEVELWFISIARKLVLCWLLFLCFGLGGALLNSDNPLPFVSFWLRRRKLMLFTEIINLFLFCCAFSLVIIVVCSRMLMYPQLNSPKVYVLYDNLDYLPNWIFEVAFFPIVKTGYKVYGRGSVSEKIIAKESLTEALENAEVIFIASHGMEDGILYSKGTIRVEDIQSIKKNPNLKFVYLASCKSGMLKEMWDNAFAPAKVLTYSRMTATFEHVWWFWSKGPKVVMGEYSNN